MHGFTCCICLFGFSLRIYMFFSLGSSICVAVSIAFVQIGFYLKQKYHFAKRFSLVLFFFLHFFPESKKNTKHSSIKWFNLNAHFSIFGWTTIFPLPCNSIVFCPSWLAESKREKNQRQAEKKSATKWKGKNTQKNRETKKKSRSMQTTITTAMKREHYRLNVCNYKICIYLYVCYNLLCTIAKLLNYTVK